MDSELLDIVKSLIDADKQEGAFDLASIKPMHRNAGYPSIIPYNKSNAKYLGENLSEEDLNHLIRALIKYSQLAGPSKSGGSASPVIPIYSEYVEKFPGSEAELTSWIIRNRINDYDPFGTIVHNDCPSYKIFLETWKQHKLYLAEQEQKRNEEKLARWEIDATEKLPNAVRRGDIKAVKALLEKGGNPKEAMIKVGSLCKLANEHGRDQMQAYLKSVGIE